jgi:hypothetical protein
MNEIFVPQGEKKRKIEEGEGRGLGWRAGMEWFVIEKISFDQLRSLSAAFQTYHLTSVFKPQTAYLPNN